MASSARTSQDYYANILGNQSAGSIRGAATASGQSENYWGNSSAPVDQEQQISWLASIVPSRQTVGVLAAIAGGLTLIGTTTYFLATRYIRNKRLREQEEEGLDYDDGYLSDQEHFNQRVADRKRRAMARNGVRPSPLITFAELYEQALLLNSHQNSARKVKMYFDSNDEFVIEDQLSELIPSPSSHRTNTNESMMDESDLIEEHQRLQDMINFKYRYVECFFGNEEQQISGTTRITRNIFAGTHDRNENALVFLDNLNKIKQTKSKQMAGKQALLLRKRHKDNDGMLSQASYPTQLDGDQGSVMSGYGRQDDFNSDTGFESLDPVYEDQSVDEDEVLLNISPNKFEKPKDQLYMDFFVKYTELFVQEQAPPLKLGTSRQSSSNQHSAPGNKANSRPVPGQQRMRLVATSSQNDRRAVSTRLGHN